MKLNTLLIVAFLSLSTLCALEILVEPQGKYREIDVQKSAELIETLTNNSYDFFGRKQEAANRLYQDVGSYNPVALMSASIYYFKGKDFEKSALLCVGALTRSDIDILISQDKSVGDVSTILMMQLIEEVQQSSFSREEYEKWEKAFQCATEKAEDWHRTTPCNYDERWVRLHSIDAFNESNFEEISQEEKKEIINKYFLRFKGIEEIAYDDLSEDGEFSFDPEMRIFTHIESGLCFHLPEVFNPQIDFWGKELLSSFKYGGFTIYLNYGCSSNQFSFEREYELACQIKDPSEEIQLTTIGNSIQAYHIRSVDGDSVTNQFVFLNTPYSFEFDATCSLEKEQELLIDLEVVLKSVRLDS